MEWKGESFLIATGEGPRAVGGRTLVQGEVYGPLGIHLSLEPFLVDGQRLFPEPDRWIVTHLGTGRALGIAWNKKWAQVYAQKLVDDLEPGVWDFTRPEDAPKDLREAVLIIRGALERGQPN